MIYGVNIEKMYKCQTYIEFHSSMVQLYKENTGCMVFLNAQSSGQCWKKTLNILLSWHVIVSMYCTWILFSKTCWLTVQWKVMNDGKTCFFGYLKQMLKLGLYYFYEPFVISSISSSTLALRLFLLLPGTWPVLNNISSLCTSSRERALAIAAWRLKSKIIVKPYLTDLFITFNILQSGRNYVRMPKINAKYELPTLPCKLFEARLSPKFTVAYMYS